MQDRDIQNLKEQLTAFRKRVEKMVAESSKEAKKHVAREELPLEVPFHEGEAGGYEIVLSVLNDLSGKGSSLSLNAIEEVYLGLLLDYKRIKGSATALETAISEMQNIFDLPIEKEVEENERHAKALWAYAAKSPLTRKPISRQ
jgi:hypothetical protein